MARAAGLCGVCGKREPESDYKTCPRCLKSSADCRARQREADPDKNKQIQSARYYARTSKGLCPYCGLPSGDKVYCPGCREKRYLGSYKEQTTVRERA